MMFIVSSVSFSLSSLYEETYSSLFSPGQLATLSQVHSPTHTFPPMVIRVCLAVKTVGENCILIGSLSDKACLCRVLLLHSRPCHLRCVLTLPRGGWWESLLRHPKAKGHGLKGHTLEPASFFSLQLCEEGSASLLDWCFFKHTKIYT